MKRSRRVRTRTVFVATGLGAAALTGLAMATAGLAALRGELLPLLPPPVAADVVRSVAAAMLVIGLLAALASATLALLLSRALTRPLDLMRQALLRRKGSPEIARLRTGPLADLRVLGQAVRARLEREESRIAELERERGELARLLGGVGEGIVQLSGEGRVLRANPAASQMLGLPEPAEGETFATLVRQLEIRLAATAALEGSPAEPREVVLEDRQLLIVAEPLGASDEDGGAVDGAVVVLIDVTEIRRLEGVRRDFVANASHELKTPLTSIRGYAETLLADDPPAETRAQFLSVIAQNARRLQQIVEDLLDLSRLESGGWIPAEGAVDLRAAVSDAWSPFAERAAEAGVVLEVDPSAEASLGADPVAVRQILTNLFDNSLRYTGSGDRIVVRGRETVDPAGRAGIDAARASAGPTVASMRTRRSGGGGRRGAFIVEVADTGTGIPAESLPRIFERFYRADPARSRGEGGTGLGLAIVKHLMERMGGSVQAQSELGRGTSILLAFPR